MIVCERVSSFSKCRQAGVQAAHKPIDEAASLVWSSALEHGGEIDAHPSARQSFQARLLAARCLTVEVGGDSEEILRAKCQSVVAMPRRGWRSRDFLNSQPCEPLVHSRCQVALRMLGWHDSRCRVG